MRNPIFAFSDDLDIFNNAEAAERYLEPWMLGQITVFDSEGRYLKCRLERKPRRFLWGLFRGSFESLKFEEMPDVSPEELRLRLVSYLVRLAEYKSLTMPSGINSCNLKSLIQIALEMKGYTS